MIQASTATYGNRIELSRRRLFSTLAAATVFTPILGRTATSLAQTPARGKATIQNIRAATLAPEGAPATLEEVLQAGLERGLTGVVLRVERGGEVVFEEAAGLASLERETPLTPADRFRIASVTKTFTAVLALQLVDEGALTLDDTVSAWLDDPVVRNIPHVDQITLRQLMNHTSGIYDYFDDDSPFWQDAYFGPEADWTRIWSPLEVLAYVDGARHAPYFAPGEGAHYCNTAYVLLGLIVEAAAGQSYVERLRARILEPLGLVDTFFAAAEPVVGGEVEAYHLIEGELVNVSATHLSASGTAGGMVSTARDLARFAGALLGGELLRPATLAQMLTFVPSEWPVAEWGLGTIRAQTPGGKVVGHSGDGPGSAARMYRLFDADLTLVLLTNTGGDDATVDAIFFDQAVRAALGTDAPNG